MNKETIEEVFLSLVRLGVGHSGGMASIPNDLDWNMLEELAARQGLSAILVDGVERLPEGQRPPKHVLLQWIGETLQGYEYRYELYCRTIAEMAAFYNEHSFKMMVLKGYACSLDWPRLEHRPCGDIDIWQFGKQKEADVLLAREKGVEIDKSHLHHTVFYWRDFMVENHYEIVNTHVSCLNAKIEKIFKELAMNDEYYVDIFGERVWLPSPNFHVLFLLRHAILHFTSADGLSLRQVLDWGFFVQKNWKSIDWNWLHSILEEFGMKQFFDCINQICTKDLGFDFDGFPQGDTNEYMRKRVLEDILKTTNNDDEPDGFISRLWFKYRRRKTNEWKHTLCYKESLRSHLLSSLWLHITHPGMI